MIIAVIVTTIVLLKLNKPTVDRLDINSCTGTEWLSEQGGVLLAYEELAENYEDVYALYISGAMSPTDFVNELIICQAELFGIQQEYTESKSERRITLTTEAEKQGISAFEDLFIVTNKMFTASVSGDQPHPAEEVGYIYLSYKSVIKDDLDMYMLALVEGGERK